jgi:hypothetical protein
MSSAYYTELFEKYPLTDYQYHRLMTNITVNDTLSTSNSKNISNMSAFIVTFNKKQYILVISNCSDTYSSNFYLMSDRRLKYHEFLQIMRSLPQKN